jgi:beta-N-acetylhexosaminidase
VRLTSGKVQTCLLILVIAVFTLHSNRTRLVEAQDPVEASDPAVEAIFEALTAEERVGQLFLVSFKGNRVDPDSNIAELIQKYRIGAVSISAENENFSNGLTTPAQILFLTNRLQGLAQKSPALSTSDGSDSAVLTATPTITSASLTTTLVTSYSPLPLLIAVEHEGDGFPHTQIRGKLLEIPNQMALGATWDTENARLVGWSVGHDLSYLGINTLLGPSLDVIDSPRLDGGNSLGTRTYGGDPHWVGEMGQAYIRGVGEGSGGKILTIAKHFPGFGSSDREINQGVPTILKSLDDLRRTELLPFFKVTQLTPDDTTGVVDGLMTAHVRYQGLQGNVPISLDARNLPAILALKEFASWRSDGGLVVSAPLGVPASLEGISANREVFPARRLAQDAFLAGSDILQLVDFSHRDKPETELDNIKNAIEFFQERYTADPNFQAAVDRAVRRIIKAKIKIYGQDLFQAETQQSLEILEELGTLPIDLDQIAQAGVTLITPATQEGISPLPDPPQPNEMILIFTDDRLARDCPNCPEFSYVETEALEEIMLQLFGPEATGQLFPDQITSLGFSDLKSVLSNEEFEARVEIEDRIEAADWIIFAMLDINTRRAPQSDAVRVLLRNRFEDLRKKKLVLFAFSAPYFLDETEISQLTAYYGFYSKTRDYIEAAARLLFQQFKPSGASPVGIPAIGALDLSPDPAQNIELEPVHKIDVTGKIVALEEPLEAGTTLDLEIGEGILFRTSTIVDKNGSPVPNGTLVDFFRFYPLEGLSLEPMQSLTNQGIAEIMIIKERETPLQVRASSNLAVDSATFNIGPGIIDTPTPTPTSTPTPTNTPVPTATSTETATPVIIVITPTVEPTPVPTPIILEPPNPPSSPLSLIDLAYSLVGMLVIGGIAFTIGGDRFSLEERVRPTLVAIALGLVGYIFYAFMAMASPQTGYMHEIVEQNSSSHWVAPVISLVFAIAGVIAWYLKPGRIFWKNVR